MLSFRNKLNYTDPEVIRKISLSTGFFDKDDVEVSVAIAQRALKNQNHNNDNLNFLFAEDNGKTCAYACFGEVPESISTYELHWLSTLNEYRGHGIGKKLIQEFIDKVKEKGGRKIFVKTSGIEMYKPTHQFYESCGFALEARLNDYYDEGDDCLIYAKRIK